MNNDGQLNFVESSLDQNEFEHSLVRKAADALAEEDNNLDQRRKDKTLKQIKNVENHILKLRKSEQSRTCRISEKERLRNEISLLQNDQLSRLQQDLKDINDRMASRNKEKNTEGMYAQSNGMQLPDETTKDFLIRTGKITPFSDSHESLEQSDSRPRSNLRIPGSEFADWKRPSGTKSVERESSALLEGDDELESLGSDNEKENISDGHFFDDAQQLSYERRVSLWAENRRKYRLANKENFDNQDVEQFMPHPTESNGVLSDDFQIPGDIFSCLFEYQKTGVRWLYELYCQRVGGIIGDEMGLGKTIQICAFLAGLCYSKKLDQPVLIVCPATIMKQWVNELHTWWPPLRVFLLHSIGAGMGRNFIADDISFDEEEADFTNSKSSLSKAEVLISSAMNSYGSVVITTYAGMRTYGSLLNGHNWKYCVLDEGHKIRNPDSEITLACKRIKTTNRIILSGTPIQNNLIELWSLFDFVFPGKLGTLPVFQTQFSVPINIGGYANASNVQVQTAYKCAVVLKDTIAPYLLRRMKVDVAADLPQKVEKVLFCKMTADQKDAYSIFLASDEMKSIFARKRQVLYGVDILRKICNHPDLAQRDVLIHKEGYDYGNPKRSGKMQVTGELIKLWSSQHHRTLLFTQTRQMLDILESFVQKIVGREHILRMDGSTTIGRRQALVDRFNEDESIHVFLLTTRVGGLGVNLTGADRVLIFDPDWNPSTDVQARERAWRLGQKKNVSIYRLMLAGTIEEKIYHRQIFKQFLTNKILKDPKQKRFFKSSDIHDLFSLGDVSEGTETGQLFRGLESTKKNDKLPMKKKFEDDLEELSNLHGLSKMEDLAEGHREQKRDTEEEDRILEGLFSSGVHSALQHDAIMESTNPDSVIVEKEAARVAKSAAHALKMSQRLTRNAAVGTPTWTGRSGAAGRIAKRKPGVNLKPDFSSNSILQNIKFRKSLEQKNSDFVESDTKHSTLKNIVDFLNHQPECSSNSKAIITACNIPVDTEQSVATLRHMLQEVATWNSGMWLLKDSYKESP